MKQIPGKDKVLSMLGLAARSRNVVSGGFATEQAVKCGKAALVIIAEDASGNTRKKYSNMCDFYEVPCAFHGQGREIGSCGDRRGICRFDTEAFGRFGIVGGSKYGEDEST